MKKTLIILATIVGVVLLGNVLIVSAQGAGPGPNGDWMTQMHEAVWTAVAEELGLTYDELVAAVQDGQTIWQIAEEQGVSVERLREVMLDARAAALADLVEQGVITQEQADWMLSHSQGMLGNGFGHCGGNAGFMGRGGMMGGRGMMGNGGFGPMHPGANRTAPSRSNG
ncbi:MAG TPA: LysM domain-containing protein [Anaerolineae bacterium]|nr:LysM domain-containing protein [Anaerolineae bacterium]